MIILILHLQALKHKFVFHNRKTTPHEKKEETIETLQYGGYCQYQVQKVQICKTFESSKQNLRKTSSVCQETNFINMKHKLKEAKLTNSQTLIISVTQQNTWCCKRIFRNYLDTQTNIACLMQGNFQWRESNESFLKGEKFKHELVFALKIPPEMSWFFLQELKLQRTYNQSIN